MATNRAGFLIVCALLAAAVVATLLTLAVVGTTAANQSSAPAARPSCATALIRDWADGRIDRTYTVGCYRAALSSLPSDLRIYSSAADDIRQALSARITQSSLPRELAAHG